MTISTRDTTAGGLSSDRSSLTETRARSESTPDRPNPGTGTDLDREAERFSALLQAKPESKATDDGDSALGGSRAKEPSHPSGGRMARQDDSIKISDNRNEPQRSTNAQIIQDAAANFSPTKNASQSTGASKSKDIESSPSTSSTLPTGDRILQGLGQHSAAVENTPTPAASAAQTSDRVEQIERLGERLAQRILVSDRSQVGDSEIRIQLRESVLQGGEIRLRQEHGQLVVSIQIPSTDLARQLSGQTDTLQQTLANRLETQVRVEVQVVGARDAGNDANPGDGRSRNRRDPWDAYEDQGA